jgi:G:T-mismatch repair DNA endonuclease (very short patch repair protein)
MEQMDGCRIMHARNGREYRPPELAKYSVDGYCPETKVIYEFFGCFWHGHTCQPYRDVSTMSGDTLAERYELKMSRLEKITQAGYQVKIQWECEIDSAGIVNQKPELHTHPIVEQSPLHTRDALYGGQTEAMRLHYKARENETIQYVDVMSLYQ